MSMPSEKELFKILASVFGGTETELGVRDLDDAAVIDFGSVKLVIATDFVRGSEFYLFQLGYINYFDVGYYLIAANVSDIAAMGCVPKGLLTVVRYSKSMGEDGYRQTLAGIAEAAKDYNCSVVGGDSGGYIADVLSATAFGIAKEGKYLRRGTGRDGDILCISGPIGGGIGALTYFKELKGKAFDLPPVEEDLLLKFWKRPTARVDVGQLLVDVCPSAACMDISDGLKASVDQLSSNSKIGYRIRRSDVPIVTTVKKIAAQTGLDPLTFASSASVDFELLFSVPAVQFAELMQEAKLREIEIYPIGRAGLAFENDLENDDGSLERFAGISWDHQEGDHVKDILSKTRL